MIALITAIVIAVLCALVYANYRHDLQAAHERTSTGSLIAQTACGSIEHAILGEGPPVLIVHGAGGGYDQGLGFGAPLAERGFRVIAVSRFGYLRTPLPDDASAAVQADAHACLLDALGIPAAAVIGASAGAPSSLQLALRHPERVSALVLLVPAAYVPHPGDAASLDTPPRTPLLFDTALRSDFLFWVAIHVVRPTMMENILATPPEVVNAASAAEQQRVAEALENILPVSPRRLGLLNDATVTSTLERYDLERIRAPTLVLSAADDLFGTFETGRYTAEHIPGARFVGFETGGHLWVGHQDDVLREVAAFLREERDAPGQRLR
jgi:pimeloyl-ACP methyl ester carboxylesterase